MMKKLSRKLLTPLMIVTAFTLIGGNTVEAAEWNGYVDVAENNVHYDAIKSLTEQDVIQGYPFNEFKPWDELKRQHAAVILNRLVDFDKPDNIAKTLEKYKDINSESDYAEDIAALTEAGVFHGDSSGNFNPAAKITREQMASVLVKAMDLDKFKRSNVSINLDKVDPSHKDNVQILANLKVTNNLDNFYPFKHISRAAVASMMYRAQHASEFDLSIMHLNDTHAHVEQMPSAVTAIKQVRKANPDALLLHGGDVFSGTLYFNEFQGQADVALMNLMGFDAVTFGNHEFDLGASPNGHQALHDYVNNAEFPFVSSNSDFSRDELFNDLVSDTPFTEDPKDGQIYNQIVKEVDGEKIGIFGLTTEDAKDIASPEKVTFSNYKKAAEDAVAAFEEQGINKIIAVTHIGYDSSPAVGNDLLLAQVEGIDVIVGGHSHTPLSKPEMVNKDEHGNDKTPTIIVQAGQYVDNLGTLDVTFDENGVVTGHSGKLLKLSAKDDDGNLIYPPDKDALKILEPFKTQVDKVFKEETTATAVNDLPNPRQEKSGVGDSVRANETALGNLITDGMLYKAPEADIALQNGGGIREKIDKGPITIGEIIEVLPFGNLPVIVDVTGEQIKEVLEHSVREAPGESGAFLHVAGMKFTFDSAKEPGNRVLEMKLKTGEDQYEDMDLNQTYTVTTNAFTAAGGDGFDTFATLYKAGKVQELGSPSDWEDLKDYMEYLGDVDPKIEGRIIDAALTK